MLPGYQDERDCFGRKLWHKNGKPTRTGRINKVVTSIPKTVGQIMMDMNEQDVTKRGAVESHLNRMSREGCFNRTEDGRYSVVAHPNGLTADDEPEDEEG